jgi:DNA polymerase (family X)
VALPSNEEVARQLELLANVLELEGEPGFRVIAYRRAAQKVREVDGSIAEQALQGNATELAGIGKIIEEKIVQIVEDGEIHALTKHKDRFPPDVVRFMELPGLGPKTAGRIWQELGITTLAELKEAALAGRLRGLTGINSRSEERILKALADVG